MLSYNTSTRCLNRTNKESDDQCYNPKINTFLTKYKDIVQMNSEIMQIEIILLEPILSSIRPREKQPTIPNKFINTPRNNMSDSVSPNKNDANIPANAKILTTALLKKIAIDKI